MKTLKNMTGDSLEQMIDFKVVDQDGGSVGTLHSLWSDPATGTVEFLGVKTGWIFGQNHVVPAEKAEFDEAMEVVRLPYTAAFVKEAPAIAAEAEISETEEENIHRYYGLDRAGGVTAAPGDNHPGVEHSVATSGKLPDSTAASTVASASETGTSHAPFGGSTGMDADATQASMSRLRRTVRPEAASAATTGGAPRSTHSVIDDAGYKDPHAAKEVEPNSYSTANMYGSTGSSTVPVAADSAGISGADSVGGSSGTLAENVGSNVTSPGDEHTGRLGTSGTAATGTNADPITGEPGSHPVGTGAGALAAGAAGAAIGGVIGGPVGAPLGAAVGAIAGAVGGGYAGKGIAETINPTAEDAYWQSNYRNASYHDEGYDYSDYGPAYRVGYEGYGRHAASDRDYNDIEKDLEKDYGVARGSSRLTWDKAKTATRDAWDRLKNKTSNATDK